MGPSGAAASPATLSRSPTSSQAQHRPPPLFSSMVRPLVILFLPMQLPHRTKAVGPVFTRAGKLSSRRQWQALRGFLPGCENGTGEVAIAPASSPCFQLVKPWPLGPISLAPMSSVAAGNGGPPCRSSSPAGRRLSSSMF
jgi:hypothetical protein